MAKTYEEGDIVWLKDEVLTWGEPEIEDDPLYTVFSDMLRGQEVTIVHDYEDGDFQVALTEDANTLGIVNQRHFDLGRIVGYFEKGDWVKVKDEPLTYRWNGEVVNLLSSDEVRVRSMGSVYEITSVDEDGDVFLGGGAGVWLSPQHLKKAHVIKTEISPEVKEQFSPLLNVSCSLLSEGSVTYMGEDATVREPDMVNSPPHYNGHPKGIEAIDVIEEADSLNLGNAMKYLWRVLWGSKGRDIEDLNKAVWYINREIERRNEDA